VCGWVGGGGWSVVGGRDSGLPPRPVMPRQFRLPSTSAGGRFQMSHTRVSRGCRHRLSSRPHGMPAVHHVLVCIQKMPATPVPATTCAIGREEIDGRPLQRPCMHPGPGWHRQKKGPLPRHSGPNVFEIVAEAAGVFDETQGAYGRVRPSRAARITSMHMRPARLCDATERRLVSPVNHGYDVAGYSSSR